MGVLSALETVLVLVFVGLFVAVFFFVAYDTYLTARKKIAKKHD